MKVKLIFAEEWTTKTLEKDPENIELTGNRTLTTVSDTLWNPI